jgi:cytoplasmic iron level regulating protein YaaA (DUF328/UPF0246 family)
VLAAAEGGDQKLLGVGGKNLDRAQLANAALVGSRTLPAWRRYTGVVWGGLDVGSLPVEMKRRALSSVVVVSGLLGLVAMNDPTPDYRLKMGASLPPLGRLSTWWRPHIAAPMTSWASRRFVVDLLANEHRAACSGARMRGVSVTFTEHTGKVSGHDAKAAKGRLARHLLTAPGHPLDALQSWSDPRFELVITPIGG